MSKRFSPSQSVVILWLAMIPLAGCNLPSGGSAGPMVWIDRPLDGKTVPLEPLIVQAHASDTDGIAKIEFLVFDSLISDVSTGGARLEDASIEWMPPAPGIYTLNVRATDAQGNSSARTPASVQITVSGDTSTSTPTPAPASGQCTVETLVAPLLLSPADGTTVTGEPLLTWSYPDTSCHPYSFAVDISSDTSFTDISLGFGTLNYIETSRQWPLPAGQCYYWRVKAYVPDVNGPPSPAWRFCVSDSITATPSSPIFTLLKNANCRLGPGTAYDNADTLLQGASAAIEGRNEDNSWFWVLKSLGNGHCWISASVGTASGNWQVVPVIAAPPLPATVTPTPADLTPPEISDLSANPAIISVQTQCGATPPTTVISARVTDPGGIARVVARVSGVGEFEMSPVGGGYYQATLGPFGEAGTLSVFVQAQDNAGNAATSAPIEVQVVACPG